MSEYRQRVLKSHIDKDPDRYLPSRQQSHGSKEIKGVSILKPNPTGAAFHKYPGEHVIVLNGENLSFCRKVRLGDKLEVKIPAEDVTPRMIQLNLKPSGETKSLISKTGTVKVTIFSHFSKSMTKKVPVTQVYIGFNNVCVCVRERERERESRHTENNECAIVQNPRRMLWHCYDCMRTYTKKK